MQWYYYKFIKIMSQNPIFDVLASQSQQPQNSANKMGQSTMASNNNLGQNQMGGMNSPMGGSMQNPMGGMPIMGSTGGNMGGMNNMMNQMQAMMNQMNSMQRPNQNNSGTGGYPNFGSMPQNNNFSQIQQQSNNITVNFRLADGSSFNIATTLNSTTEELIQKFRDKSGMQDESLKFTFNGGEIVSSRTTTLSQIGIGPNCLVYVITTKFIKGGFN